MLKNDEDTSKFQTSFIHVYSIFKTEIQSIAYQSMTDRHFQESFNVLSEISQVIEVKVVTCIDAETHLHGGAGCLDKGSTAASGLAA